MGGRPRARLVPLALALVLSLAGALAGPLARASAAQTIAGDPTPTAPASRVETHVFESAALHRAMPYLIYLPPGYSASTARYPVLYMLHGMGGSNSEWRGYGLLDAADRMIADGSIEPLIIVMPQGDHAYWVDHAGTDREAWGTYTARDLVAEVDAHHRTVPARAARAIGGDSMGAHGALQLALNHVDTFSIVGSHSLVLRPFDQALAFFGDRSDFAKRDPLTIVRARPELARSLDLWIDIGSRDPWAARAEQFSAELDRLGIAHRWHEWPGDHSRTYWGAHVSDYLRFYDRAFRHDAESPVEALLVP